MLPTKFSFLIIGARDGVVCVLKRLLLSLLLSVILVIFILWKIAKGKFRNADDRIWLIISRQVTSSETCTSVPQVINTSNRLNKQLKQEKIATKHIKWNYYISNVDSVQLSTYWKKCREYNSQYKLLSSCNNQWNVLTQNLFINKCRVVITLNDSTLLVICMTPSSCPHWYWTLKVCHSPGL